MAADTVGYIRVHGKTADKGEMADDASSIAPTVFKSHIGEDIAETLRYGGAHALKRTSCSSTLSGREFVEVGEPIKWVPPNGKSLSI